MSFFVINGIKVQILVRVLLTVESICSTSIRVVGEMKNPVTRKVLIYFIGFVGGDSGSYYKYTLGVQLSSSCRVGSFVSQGDEDGH